MDTKYICEYCNSCFTTKSNLTAHQKNAKKCILIQKEKKETNFVCINCNEKFISEQKLSKHVSKCTNFIAIEYQKLKTEYVSLQKEKEKEIIELKQQIRDLQDKLSNIAEIGAKKTTTTNYRINANIISQLSPYDLDKEKIKTIVNEKFTENHLYAKENGIANFAVYNLLKDDDGYKMTCTDTARKTFMYKDDNGNIYKDPNAIDFLEKYIPAVKKKSYEIISDKDGDDMIELSECITNIDESIISSKLANKLVFKPK
jgi:hypothetical protein